MGSGWSLSAKLKSESSQRSYDNKLRQRNKNLSLNHIRLQVLHARYVVRFNVFKMKEKFIRMRLYWLHAGEKFAADRDIVRHEVAGLRNAVLHEKKRRKRGKAMHLYDEGETEGQGRFFSPAKIVRLRERMAAAEDAQQQHQLTVRDKKLQACIARDDKRREADERKQQRQSARQVVREQLACEKAERQAVREAQRAKRTAEAVQHKREVEARRTQRIRVKELKQNIVQSKKRSLEEDEVDRPQKRARMTASRIRNAGAAPRSTTGSISRVVQPSARTISSPAESSSNVRVAEQLKGPILHSERSGRAVRLPTRFR